MSFVYLNKTEEILDCGTLLLLVSVTLGSETSSWVKNEHYNSCTAPYIKALFRVV
jgi:hypothetical protein